MQTDGPDQGQRSRPVCKRDSTRKRGTDKSCWATGTYRAVVTYVQARAADNLSKILQIEASIEGLDGLNLSGDATRYIGSLPLTTKLSDAS